ncbi:MAG: class I SAM-dependent methyltransferase [Candidatus Sericytochromatia bacterium]
MNEYDTHSELYDFLYLGLPSEKEFYVSEALRIGGDVLELGCGTGRITIPVAQAGLNIIGIDNSEGLLKEGNDKISKIKQIAGSVELKYGDMRDFNLDKKFDLIIIPYRAFLHLYTPEDQKKTLKNIHNHLKENGKLIMNMFFPRIDIIDSNMNSLGNAVKQVKVLEKGKNKIVFYDSRNYSSYSQLINQYFIAEELDEKGVVISKQYFPLTLRWVTRFEMEHLFELCGFKIENLFGWFDKRPFSDASEEMVWVVKKV